MKLFQKALVLGALLIHGGHCAQFRVFDNTAYTNTSIGYGSTPINWIPAYVCNPLTKNGLTPDENHWKDIVREWNIFPGYPLVLDCENIYFTDTETGDRNLNIMSSLQTWAADVAPPGEIIGWYGLSGNTIPALYDHYRSLISNHSNHAFFPSAYTYSYNLDPWKSKLESVLQTIKKINSSLPVWPYTWPQYHNNFTFFPVEVWEDQLHTLSQNENVNGFVIWGGKNHANCDDSCQAIAGKQPWLSATRSFLDNVYGLSDNLQQPWLSTTRLFIDDIYRLSGGQKRGGAQTFDYV